MKFASILLALVVVPGFVREAGAADNRSDYSFRIGNQRYGIRDVVDGHDGSYVAEDELLEGTATQLCLGPIGSFAVPFSATVGLIGFPVILAGLIIVPVVLTVRWKRKRRSIKRSRIVYVKLQANLVHLRLLPVIWQNFATKAVGKNTN